MLGASHRQLGASLGETKHILGLMNPLLGNLSSLETKGLKKAPINGKQWLISR